MSTFADPAMKTAMRQRMERVTPDSRRAWGRMTPHQMICHLSDAYRMAAGERQPKPLDNFISRSVVRYVALHTSMSWPKGVKTVPEADQEKGGTKPAEWDRDIAELIRLHDAFRATEGHRHPLFGPLTEAEWNVWAFRHTNHHLTQFGCDRCGARPWRAASRLVSTPLEQTRYRPECRYSTQERVRYL